MISRFLNLQDHSNRASIKSAGKFKIKMASNLEIKEFLILKNLKLFRRTPMFKNFLLVFLVSLLASCNEGETTIGTGNSSVDISSLNGDDGLSYLSLIVLISCDDGQNGFEYQTGPDNDPQNGKLDEDEVESSAFICPLPAPAGWAQKLSYLEPSEDSICGYDPRGSMLLENWKDDGNWELDENELVVNSLEWCHGSTGPQGADGENGLTPLFHREEFQNSLGQSCSRLSIGYDTVYENGILDLADFLPLINNWGEQH